MFMRINFRLSLFRQVFYFHLIVIYFCCWLQPQETLQRGIQKNNLVRPPANISGVQIID